MSASSNPIDAEARGQLRAWQAAADGKWQRMEALCHSREFETAARDLALRGSRDGRTRAFAKLRRGFALCAFLEGVRVDVAAPLAVRSVLSPRMAVAVNTDDPARQHDCVVEYLLAGKLPDGTPANGYAGLWTLEVSDQALGPLLQRDGHADPSQVLLAACAAAPRTASIAACFTDLKRVFWIPAGAGVLCCTLIRAKDISDLELQLHTRVVTWLHRDQLRDRQEGEVIIDDGAPGARLGESHLLPALRHYTELGW
jgi:hypothetical protein